MLMKHTHSCALVMAILWTGCESHLSEPIPTTAPAAAAEPKEILKNIQYIGSRKDLKHLQAITPSDLNVAYAAACRLHRHAGSLGITLSDHYIMALGVTDLRTKGYLAPDVCRKGLLETKRTSGVNALPGMAKLDRTKLDLLPETDTLPDGRPNPEFQEIKRNYALTAMQAGLFRVFSGVPEDMWPKLEVMQAKADEQGRDLHHVFVGYKGTAVMEVWVLRNKTGDYAIHDVILCSVPKELKAMLEAGK